MSVATRSSPRTLQALYRANLGILNQKLDLIQILRDEFGDDAAKDCYQQPCRIVGASIGQHVRHSMDHIELAAQMAIQCTTASCNDGGRGSSSSSVNQRQIHYDLRQRGGSDEYDMDDAEGRIRRVCHMIQHEAVRPDDDDYSFEPHAVSVYFMLSGEDGDEFRLPSTIYRELGFAAHHAIHHMAMVKVIAQETFQLSPERLPLNFGKAPSTVNFENIIITTAEKGS
ncbi:hypothetical protein IV203_024417 [Nitzschia inconspicua]|uniref:Uncharacterized protein n=1 Tax=Nitzschia inconspicua TaxID=303405 RepID=A0A9K3PDB3_9STRA|nr:hypothetical protein IV203_024417 [Nitzschia inconspicua]